MLRDSSWKIFYWKEIGIVREALMDISEGYYWLGSFANLPIVVES